MMQAIRVEKFGGVEVLQVQKIPIPTISNTQVLVRIFCAGVNPVDTYIREGHYKRLPKLPFTPGIDGAGIIEKVGDEVTQFEKGQRVFICTKSQVQLGTYSDYAVAEEEETFPLGDWLRFDQGAAIGIPYFTAYRALFQKGRAVAGETVLIHGASGAVGLAAVQLAKHHNLCVIGTAGTAEGMEVVKNDAHADYVLCHRDSDYLEKVMEITESRGVDIIVEMLSNVNLGKDLEYLAPLGRVLVVGCRGCVSINPRLMMHPETMIIGVALFNSTKEEWKGAADYVTKGIADRKIVPIVDKVYSLGQCQDAHRDVIESTGAKGKLVLNINP